MEIAKKLCLKVNCHLLLSYLNFRSESTVWVYKVLIVYLNSTTSTDLVSFATSITSS